MRHMHIAGTHVTRFTGTLVQILTQKALLDAINHVIDDFNVFLKENKAASLAKGEVFVCVCVCVCVLIYLL